MGLQVAASTKGGGPLGGTVALGLLLLLLLWIPIATLCYPAQAVTTVSYHEAGSIARNIQHRSGCMEVAVNGYAPLQDFVRFGLSVAGFHPTSQEAAAFMPPLRQLFLSLAPDGPFNAKEGEEDDSAASLFTFIRTQNESSGGSSVFSGTQIPACHSLCSQEAEPTTNADFCDLLSKWHRLQRFLKQLHKALDIPRKQSVQTEENNNNKAREGVAVVVVGGGPVGLLSAIEAYKGGAASVHLVEKRGDYSRDTWFDLYDHPFSPAFAWLQELAYHLLQPDMQYVLNDRDTDYRDDDGRQQPQSNEGENERPPKQVAVVTIRAQVLERFLAKVASILGINLYYDREFVAYCPPQQWQKTSELPTGGGRYRALLYHTKEALSPEIFSMELPYSASFWCHDGTSPTTTALQHEIQNAHLLTCNKNGDDDENIQKQSALFEWLPFDVLVAADGASSQVRRFAGIPFTTQETFKVTPYHKITVPDLHQTTLLVNFKSAYKSNIGYDDGDRNTKASGCLVVKDLPVDHAGLIIDGVSGVYKRFYYGHCHMQVLFTDDYSNRLRLMRSNNGSYQASASKEDHSFRFWRSGSSSALPTTAINATNEAQQHIPWDKLLEVSNELLEMPYASLSELQETISLKQKVGRTSSTVTQREQEGEQEKEEEANQEYDVGLFDIRIKKAAQYTKLEVFSSSFNKDEAGGKDSAAVIFLSGDASVTAHYRLGIGINNAFEALSELSSLIHHLSLPHHLPQNAKERAKSWAYAVAERERRASQRIDRMVQLQLSTMFFESYCDFGVWFDAEAPSIYASQVVLAKHRPSRDYLPPHGLNAVEVLQLATVAFTGAITNLGWFLRVPLPSLVSVAVASKSKGTPGGKERRAINFTLTDKAMQGCLRRSGLPRAFGTSCSLCGGARSSLSSSLLLSRSQPTTRFYSVASSPSTISATNDLRAAAATPPKYFPDEVPGLHTARLRFPLQRLPLSDKASGYQPPLGNTGHLPFRVVRTKSGMLPVYRDYKNGRTKVVTVVRKFIGDTKALKQEIYNVLGGSANEIEIKERQGSLEIKGDYVWHLNIYLKKLGF